MDENQKEEFITSLCNSVRDELIGKIPKMPETWNGWELRQLIAEKFDREKMNRKSFGRRRMREYRNECYIRNL